MKELKTIGNKLLKTKGVEYVKILVDMKDGMRYSFIKNKDE